MNELKNLWDKEYSYWYKKAEKEIGEYSHDEEAYGDSYISTGEYLINEDEVSKRAWELFEDDFSEFAEENKDELAEHFMPDYDTCLDDDLIEAIEKWEPDFKTIKEKMEK